MSLRDYRLAELSRAIASELCPIRKADLVRTRYTILLSKA